jgi:hypothetical protein
MEAAVGSWSEEVRNRNGQLGSDILTLVLVVSGSGINSGGQGRLFGGLELEAAFWTRCSPVGNGSGHLFLNHSIGCLEFRHEIWPSGDSGIFIWWSGLMPWWWGKRSSAPLHISFNSLEL